MTTAEAVTDKEARTFFDYVRDSTFTFTDSQLPELLADLGWTVITETPHGSAIAQSGWNLAKGHVYITRLNDHISMLDISLTNTIDREASTPARVHGHFARLTAIAIDAFGPPTLTEPGMTPTVRWRLGPTTVILTRLPRGVGMTWTSTHDQDREDEREEEETPATAWAELITHLANDLRNLAAGDTLIIRHGKRYVQLVQRSDFVRAEASSNTFLTGEHRLDPDQEQALRHAGWQDPAPGMNSNLDLPWPSSPADIRAYATTLITTLAQVFGAQAPDELSLEAWGTATGRKRHLMLNLSTALAHDCTTCL